MSKIEKLIFENYQDSSKLISLIRKYDFENFLNGTLTEIEMAINSLDSKRLSELATASLIKINENLKGIKAREKEYLEFLLSDIFQSILLNIESSETLSEIQETLLNACNISGYKYEVLEQMLGLKKQQVLKPRQTNSVLPYYEWKGVDYELNGLLDFLTDNKIIISKREFRKLFNPISEHFYYQADKEKVSDLVLVFSVLKEKKLLKPKKNSGHFAPIVRYGVDNDNNYLFKKRPNKILEYLKRDDAVYCKLRGRYERIINNIAKKTLGQRVDNGQSPQKLR